MDPLGYLFPTFSKMVWFASYKQIGIVFTFNNNNNNNYWIVDYLNRWAYFSPKLAVLPLKSYTKVASAPSSAAAGLSYGSAASSLF